MRRQNIGGLDKGGSNSVAIDIDWLVSSLKDELRYDQSSMPPCYCIFKTPSILFRHREASFIPNCFSIGPMHYGKENLVPSDKIKIKHLKGLLSRMILATPAVTAGALSGRAKEIEEEKTLSYLVVAIKSIEKKASAYYGVQDFAAKLGDNFLKLLVLDGCFIIELFRRDADVVVKEPDDPIFSMSCMLQFLHHDLMLLENQIPWLVLEILFEKTKLPSETDESLIQYALHFFRNTFSTHPPPIQPTLCKGENIKHILDLLRLSLILHSEEIKNNKPSEWQLVPCVSRLKEAGVEFKKVTLDSILDIKFRGGILEIPSLLFQETTETILRNLIAYEQCLPNIRPIFTSYARLLEELITTLMTLKCYATD